MTEDATLKSTSHLGFNWDMAPKDGNKITVSIRVAKVTREPKSPPLPCLKPPDMMPTANDIIGNGFSELDRMAARLSLVVASNAY